MPSIPLTGRVAVVTGASPGSGRLLAVAADVTSAGEVEAAFVRVGDEFGTPELVFACAGTADVVGPLWLADGERLSTATSATGSRVSAFAVAKAGITAADE